MTVIRLWTSVAAAALLASAAQAQSTTFGLEDAATDVVDEIRDDVDDDFERDIDVEGNAGRQLGYSGSIAGRATATSGNEEDTDVGIGARYGYAQGIAVFDDFGGEIDELEDDEISGNREDIFVGLGLGFRLVETERFAWGVQAGPGYRWIERFDDPATAEDEGIQIEEEALSVSSDLLYQFTDTVALSNDTDVIASDETTTVTNDLALVVGISEALQLRTSLLTEYNSDPAIDGVKETDNTLGVAVVYNF